MSLAAELIVLVGALAIVGAVFVRGVPRQKAAAFFGGLFIVGGTIFGGLAWMGIPAFITLPGDEPPAEQGLFTVVWLTTSDTDRTETGEAISPDGHLLTYTMSDGNMDGLGDLTLDVRVTNMNVLGTTGEVWPFRGEITFYSTPKNTGGIAVPIVNLTDFNSRIAVTWSGSEAGSPTFSQQGDKVVSNDWGTGMSETMNIDIEMSPTSAALVESDDYTHVDFSIGGISLVVVLAEGA